jgi:hypothetical protein
MKNVITRAMIMLGKESVTSTDVYLQPLIDEFQLLWRGYKPLMHIHGQHSTSKQCVCGANTISQHTG